MRSVVLDTKKRRNAYILLHSSCTLGGNRYTLFCAVMAVAVSLRQNETEIMAKRIRISNETLNCFGTWVKTDGVDLEQFRRNPVMLWMHWRGIIIGSIRDLKVEGAEITGEPYFDEVRDESKLAKQQWDKGTLKMCSPYFEIVESSDDPVLLKPGQTRPTITKSKLMEVSMVDMGGNDDNIVTLSYQGNELKLATGEDSTALPLLKTDGGQTPPSNKPKTKETMNVDFKAIALKLGLPETATEADILAGIGVLQGYKTANMELRKQLDDIKLAGVTQMVDDAIKAGKFNADKREHFIGLGKTMGADSLKLTLDSMAAAIKPMQLLNTGGSGTVATGMVSGQWKKLSEVPESQLKLMRENDPNRYRELYKAEYGIDCPKF